MTGVPITPLAVEVVTTWVRDADDAWVPGPRPDRPPDRVHRGLIAPLRWLAKPPEELTNELFKAIHARGAAVSVVQETEPYPWAVGGSSAPDYVDHRIEVWYGPYVLAHAIAEVLGT